MAKAPLSPPPAPPAPPPAPNTPPVAPAPVAAVSSFKIDTDIPLPALRAAATGGDVTYPFNDLAVGQSFLIPIFVPANITDAKERETKFSEEGKTVTNRMSGAVRRFRGREGNSLKNFAIRKVNDDKQGVGVRVWRVADDEAPQSPPAPPAPPTT